MSSFERLISTKVYEWKRKQMRIKDKKEKMGNMTIKQSATKYTQSIKKPQIITFSVGQTQENSKERLPKRRVQARKEAQLKKLIGIGLMCIGMILLLTRCFSRTAEEAVEQVYSQPVFKVNQDINQKVYNLSESYQVFLQDFIDDGGVIKQLFETSLNQKQEDAHTFAVWALQHFCHTGTQAIAKPSYSTDISDFIIAFGMYEDAKKFFEQFISDIRVFPIENRASYTYSNGWKTDRTYKGERKHYGIDIMSKTNEEIPIVSVTDGVVEQVGWNELGGYRVGIRSKGGAYFYYAHMKDAPKHIKKGDWVTAGTYIGTMGATGYGSEGTTGQFPIHLHFGIAVVNEQHQEFWVNPYGILRFLEDKA